MFSNRTDGFDPVAHAHSMVGRTYRASDHYEVGREKIREFAQAVRNHHLAHWRDDIAAAYGYPGLLAPPTFASVPGHLAYSEIFPTILRGYDLSQMIQTDQMIEYHTTIHEGDRLTFEVCLESFRRAFGGDLIGLRQVVFNHRDEPVMTSRTAIAGRSSVEPDLAQTAVESLMPAFSDPEVGPRRKRRPRRVDVPAIPRPEDHWRDAGENVVAFGSLIVGDQLPPRTVRLSVGDLVNYAGVSGDPNPIHWSEKLAHLMSLETVVAQGMLTIGLAADYVSSWLGDPGAMRALNVRLTSPVYVTEAGAEIEFTGRIKELDPVRSSAIVAIGAKHRGRNIFGRATAAVALR
ncbi:fused (3R)-hydroxyacyl-ACP dehydratase subunits HadA/HadB [Nocardia sp. NPDC057440]|uniref:fused (3R)-hydroxyacyl-ACP dehydratase subunits HadA/HadB n=1 Tax=Nocardia sp. NPDC057440 TaxID=3346134 RepID=UPI003672516C